MRILVDARVIAEPCGVGEYWGRLLGAVRAEIDGLDVVTVSRPGSVLNEILQKSSDRHVTVDWSHLLPAGRLMNRLIKRYGCDLYISPMFYMPARRLRVPMIGSVLDVIYDERPMSTVKQAVYRSHMRRCLTRSAGVVTLGQATLQAIERYYPITQYGAPRHVLAPVAHRDLEPRRKSPRAIVVIANSKKHKRVRELIDVLSDDRFRDWKVDVIGLMPALSAPSWVTFHGLVTEEAKWDLLARATFLLSASRQEGFGLPVLEAMSVGTIPVVSDIPSHREILAGHAGVLVPVHDLRQFGEAVLHLSRQPLAPLVAACRTRAESWSQGSVHSLSALLSSVMGR